MKRMFYALVGLGLATAAHAQPAPEQPAAADAAAPAPGSESASVGAAETPASSEPAATTSGTAAAPGNAAAFTDAQIDAFAAATVKVQAIDADASLAADQKQMQMRAAVTAAGLDAATYNKIGQAIATDTALRERVQTAMSRHASHAPDQG